MASVNPPSRARSVQPAPEDTRPNGHDLLVVAEWLPSPTTADEATDPTDDPLAETRYWRCRKCGQERTHRVEYTEPCAVERLPSPVMDGGYSVDDDRTRRALTEDMTVHFVERGPNYRVDSESGHTYRVDVEAETCTCPDFERRGVFCKHQRRVDLEIRAGQVPGPDGTFHR